MAAHKSDFIDIPALIQQYISKWWLFLLSIVFCVGAAFIYIRIHKQEFAVRANVLISQDDTDATSPASMAGMSAFGSLFGNNGFVYDEIFIISSHSLYRDVAKDLSLGTTYYVKTGFLKNEFAFTNYPVAVTPAAGMLDTLSFGITFKLNVNKNGKATIEGKSRKKKFTKVKDVTLPYTLETPFGLFTFAKTEFFPADKGVKETIVVQGYDSAAEELDLNVSSEIASKRSNVVEMAINTPYPVYGKAVLNKIIDLYNKRSIRQKNDQNTLSAQFIDARLAILSKDLNDIESQIQSYKQDRGIINLELEATKQFKKQTELENNLLTLRTQQEIISMASEFISNPENAYSLVPFSLNSESAPSALETYTALLLERQDMLTSARPDNVALKLLDEKIASLRKNIQTSFTKELENLNIQIRDIEKTLASTTAKLDKAPAREREYINLQRQQELKNTLYMFLLQRREEVSMVLANAFPKGIVVDEAFTLSEPLGFGKKAILLLAFIFALILPPLYLFLRKVITNHIEQRSDVEKATDIPLLGEMCEDHSGEKLIVTEGNTSSAAELFRLMRSNLLFILNDNNDRVVLLTSSSPGEGKSFISVNMAASLAVLGKKVLLIGMDIRKPVLSKYLGISPRFGLTQYLSSSDIKLEQLITPLPAAQNLDVIVAGPVPPNPAELLASTKVDEMFAVLRTQYDYIIVDTAPIGQVSDTFTLNRIADATIFVCRVNRTKASVFNELNEIYSQKRLKKLSIVVNGTSARKNYGYGNK